MGLERPRGARLGSRRHRGPAGGGTSKSLCETEPGEGSGQRGDRCGARLEIRSPAKGTEKEHR